MEDTPKVHSQTKHKRSKSRDHRNKDSLKKSNYVGASASSIVESATSTPKDSKDNLSFQIENEIKKDDKIQIQKGILGYMDRQLRVQPGIEPPRSPQRSNRSRGSDRSDKSPKHKRSKSESKRRKERKLQAAGEMEVHQANETLMKYLKQCSDLNDASGSLSGDLEISESLDEIRKVQRKTKSQRGKKSFRLIGKSQDSDLTTILNELNDDIINSDNIYNPFTPVVSPTIEQHQVDKIFVQSSSGYRAVDNNKGFFKSSTLEPNENNNLSLNKTVQLSCLVQRAWINISHVCHGLLGGLALSHLMFILSTNTYDCLALENSKTSFVSYENIYTNVFLFLAVICFVSVMDRIDLCQLWKTSENEGKSVSFRSIVLFMIYSGSIILNLLSKSVNKFHKGAENPQQNSTIVFETKPKDDPIDNEMVYLWNTLSIAQSLSAIFGWLLISTMDSDLLYNFLNQMDKYHAQ